MAITEKLRKKLEKRKQQLADKGKGFGYVTFKEGKKTVRFLNPGDDEDFAVEVILFFFGKEIGGFVSPASFGQPCAAWDAYHELKKSKDEDDNAIAATFKPRKKYFSPIITYKDEKGKEIDEEVGETLALLAGTQYAELIDWMLDEDYGDFTDPVNGYPVKVKRTGAGQFDTVYTQMKLDNSKLPKKYRGVYNPEEMVKKIIPTFEETEEKLNEFLGIDGADKKKKKKGSKDEKPSKDGKKKKKRTSDI